MAWTGPIESVEFASPSGAGTAYTFSPASTIPVGTLLVLGWSGNANSATAATCTDNAAGVPAANSYNILATQTTTGPNMQGGLIWCVTTRAILATDVITITGASASRRHGRLLSFTGQAASPLDTSAHQGPDTVSPFDIGPLGPLADTNELVVALGIMQTLSAASGGISDSTTGYTLVAGSGSGGTSVWSYAAMSYKTTAGTASETDSQAFTNVAKAIGTIIAFTQAPPAAAQRAHATRPVRVWSGR